MECICGKPYKQTTQTVETYYKNKKMRLIEVPAFICGSGHVKFAREVRRRMRFDLEMAYKSNISEWHYGA